MESAARTLIAALARRHGRELAAVAYLVLDNREAAERSAATGIAAVVRRGTYPTARIEDDALRVAMAGATVERALEAHRTTREVDPLLTATDRATLARLTALQRAVAAGHLLAGVGLEQLAAALGVPRTRVANALSDAETSVGGRAALSALLIDHQAGVALSVSPEAVERELSAPPIRRAPPAWRRPALAGGIALAGLWVIAMAAGAGADVGRDGSATVPALGAATSSTQTPRPAPATGSRLPTDERLTLADCDIQPASTPLSFRGWLPLSTLAANIDPSQAASPAYVLVTSSTAEWVGWQTGQGRPMFPRPVGRLGCAVDPATGEAKVYGVADSWQPPDMVDGCPSSPVRRYGPNLEIGGPNAFVLLPVAGRSWWSRDPAVEISVRITPLPTAEAEIRAVARPLGTGRAIEFEVRGLSIGQGRPASSNHYVTLAGATFPSAGCWLLSVAVEDVVVGSAVVPVTASVPLRPAD